MERVKNLIKIIEKILKVLICSFILGICVTIVRADDLSIQLTKEIVFKNGYGQIEAKPILKNVNNDIKVMGEYNVETKNGNVELKVNKVLYEGKIYQLSEPFISKRRLKNYLTAKLDKDAKLKLSDGNHDEILAILNGEATPAKDTTKTANTTTNNTSDVNSGSSNSYSGYGSGRSSSSGSSYTPYILSSSDTSSTTSTTSSTTSCSNPSISSNGNAIVYTLQNGKCEKNEIASSLIYSKYNTSTCQNKIDYDNMTVSIGEEKYVNIDDTEYRVESCSYNNTTSLYESSNDCQAIYDIVNYTAIIRKNYYYIWNGEEITPGTCVATSEKTKLYDDDYNSCDYRYDFVNNVAIKQTQWYYIYNNEKVNVGSCVDATDTSAFTYPMYETQEGCDCETVTVDTIDTTLCQTKLSFNGLNGGKEDATQCRYVGTYGVEILTEMTGYSFKDESKQAIKKVNQYFYGNSNEKVYIAKDVETNEAFDYQYESCGWEHNEELLLSYHKTRTYIVDDELLNLPASAVINTDKIFDGNKYEVSGCSTNIDIVIYWSQMEALAIGEFTQLHSRQVIAPDNYDSNATSWFIYTLDTNPYLETYYTDSSGEVVKQNPNNMDVKENNYTASNYLLTSASYSNKVHRCGGNKNSNTDYLTIDVPYTSMNLLDSDAVANYGNFVAYNYADKYNTVHKLNTPYTATGTEEGKTILTYEYELTFDSPIVIYASSVDFYENIVDFNDYDGEEELYVWETKTTDIENDDGTIQQIITTTYTTGVDFTPNYDLSSIESQKLCESGETQYLIADYDEYEGPELEEDNYTYREYIDLIYNDAMNPANYKATVTGVVCQNDSTEADINKSYVIMSLVNKYKSMDINQKEADSLANLNAHMEYEHYREKNKLCTYTTHLNNYYYADFATKTNWFNNQDVYEYKMYRQYRRPDGTYYYLYERQGYYLTKQPEGNLENVVGIN